MSKKVETVSPGLLKMGITEVVIGDPNQSYTVMIRAYEESDIDDGGFYMLIFSDGDTKPKKRCDYYAGLKKIGPRTIDTSVALEVSNANWVIVRVHDEERGIDTATLYKKDGLSDQVLSEWLNQQKIKTFLL